MAIIQIDGVKYEVVEGRNLLETCLELGFDIPYFCWHPAMGSVGACRQCAVKVFKDENDVKGRMIMSCMEPVTDKMIVSTKDQEVTEFRKGIIELLMINHPHDCPVCDEGGECHLQDMTVMTGHNYRRYKFKKRTFKNQYLGPLINHEMNRCIQCYRCVRFYRDYAGGKDLDVFGAHDRLYFGRHEDGVLESEFSGNLVEVCPTGVFTDKTLRKHYTRKWDLTNSPSVCTHCSLGCNIIASERYGSLRRIANRYNGEVNGYFICDRGRFGYEFVNSPLRIKEAKAGNVRFSGSVAELVKTIADKITGKVVGIGSPRASLESNYMLQQLLTSGNFYAGENRAVFRLNKKILNILYKGNVRTPSLREIKTADAVLVLGEDLTNTAPMMALAVRQASGNKPSEKAAGLKISSWNDRAVREVVQDELGPLFNITPYPTKLDEVSSAAYNDIPEKIAELGFSIASYINSNAPATETSGAFAAMAAQIADALKNAVRPLIISGTGCLNEQVIEAAYNIARALNSENKNTMLSFVLPESNSMGLAMTAEKCIDDLLEEDAVPDTLLILENDLHRRADGPAVNALIDKCSNVIVFDSIFTPAAIKSPDVIPVAAFAEATGTVVNNEGRAQRYYPAYKPAENIMESWKWLRDILSLKNSGSFSGYHFDEISSLVAGSTPYFRHMSGLGPDSEFRIAGMKIARQSHRYSGRTAINAGLSVHEPATPDDPDSPLAFTMDGYQGKPPSTVTPFFWSPGWDSNQAVTRYQESAGGKIKGGDAGVRLLEPSEGEGPAFFQCPAESPVPSQGMFRALPSYHIFGSEELSNNSMPLDELLKSPYAGLSAEDAAALGTGENSNVRIKHGEKEYTLPVKIIQGLKPGTVLIPYGLKDLYIDFYNRDIIVNA